MRARRIKSSRARPCVLCVFQIQSRELARRRLSIHCCRPKVPRDAKGSHYKRGAVAADAGDIRAHVGDGKRRGYRTTITPNTSSTVTSVSCTLCADFLLTSRMDARGVVQTYKQTKMAGATLPCVHRVRPNARFFFFKNKFDILNHKHSLIHYLNSHHETTCFLTYFCLIMEW